MPHPSLGHLDPRVGPHGSHPQVEILQEGQPRAQGNKSKMLFPLLHEPLLGVETKGKEWLEV